MGDFELLLISQGFRQLGIVYFFHVLPFKVLFKTCIELNDNKNECKFCLWPCNCVYVTGAIILYYQNRRTFFSIFNEIRFLQVSVLCEFNMM